MLPPSPTVLRFLAAACAALLAGAGARLFASLLGPSPLVLVWLALAVLAPLAAVTSTRTGDRLAPAPWKRLLRAILPCLAIVCLPVIARSLGPLRPQASTPLLVLAAGWALAVLPLSCAFAPALRGARPAVGVVVALGFGLGCFLHPLVACGLAGLASLPLVPRKGLSPVSLESGFGDLPALAAAVLGALSIWGGARAVVAPSLDGLVAFGVGLLLGHAVGRQAAPAGRAARLAVTGMGLVGLQVLWSRAPDLARDLALARLPSALEGPEVLLLAPLGLGLAGGVVCGIASGPTSRATHIVAWLGAGAGAVAFPSLPTPAFFALGLGAVSLIAVPAPAVRLAGVLALACGGAGWALVPAEPGGAAVAAWRVLRGAEEVERDSAARALQPTVFADSRLTGAATLRTRETPGAPSPDTVSWTAEVDGLTAFTSGRAAAAEGLAGVLAGSLRGGPPDRVLLLGDDAAQVLPFVVASQPGLVTVATPHPALVQQIAAIDPTSRANYLHPAVRLRAGHPDAVLRTVRDQDVVVEVARAPWSDSGHAALDKTHRAAVQQALAPGGAYVVVVHLNWWPSGTVAALAGALARDFVHLQVWLPPAGADSLLFVASDRQARLEELTKGAAPYTSLLADLGLPGVDSAASLAIGDGRSAEAWAAGAADAPTDRLNQSVGSRPVLHVDQLVPHVASPARIWETEGATTDLDTLAQRITARRTFVALLGKAAAGDMGSVFEGARDLIEVEAELATQSLAVLIEPHLQKARQALVRARVEGSNSSGWEEAQRFATTARMLSPQSLEPPLLLAEIALSQKNLNSADELFEVALGLDPNSLEALGGLARTAQARRDSGAALGWLRKATTVDGQDWRTWLNLGVQLWRMNETSEAEEALRRSSALAGPEEPAPHSALAELYLSVDRPTTALVHAERAVVLGGGSPASFYRGRAYEALNRLDDAEESYRQATLQDAQAILPRLGVARVRGLKGDLAGAAAGLRAVLALDPSHTMARAALDRIEDALRAEAAATGASLPTAP